MACLGAASDLVEAVVHASDDVEDGKKVAVAVAVACSSLVLPCQIKTAVEAALDDDADADGMLEAAALVDTLVADG